MLEGFFAGYMTATSGYGLVLFVFRDGIIVGVDAGGVKFDGTYELAVDGDVYSGTVKVTAPPDINLVQGVQTGPAGLIYNVDFEIPVNFKDEPYLRVSTPLGPVNVRIEKLRGLDT